MTRSGRCLSVCLSDSNQHRTLTTLEAIRPQTLTQNGALSEQFSE